LINGTCHPYSRCHIFSAILGQSSLRKASAPEIEEFNKIRDKEGLKAALSWNAERFAGEDA
jgi:hypothetical protein